MNSKLRFHHFGVPYHQPIEGEVYLEHYHVYHWGYEQNEFGIEMMRYEEECPLPELIKTLPHLAFEVDDLYEFIKDRHVIIEPNCPSEGNLVAFIEENGLPIELLQRNMKGSPKEIWHECMQEYRQQLEQGVIQKAYKGLMDYMMALKTHFKTTYPEYVVSGNLYTGYMDMTYFAVVPPLLKQCQLKIAIVFLHEEFRFEVWLSGANKQVQAHYWKLFQNSGWNQYPPVATTKGADAIIESITVDNPDFRDLDALTKQIERASLTFIQEIERFLATDDQVAI